MMREDYRLRFTRVWSPAAPFFLSGLLAFIHARAATVAPAAEISANWRDIATGSIIPGEDYADQLYVVKCDDGAREYACAG